MYSTSLYFDEVGELFSTVDLLGDCGDKVEETLDGKDCGEGDTAENGENGEGVVSPKSDSGDNRDVVMNGFTTSFATFTTKS